MPGSARLGAHPRSRDGARAAAVLYSLVGTAKLRGLDPGTYIRDIALEAIRKRDAETIAAAG